MNVSHLTRSVLVALILAGLVAFLPGLRIIQVAEAAGAPPKSLRALAAQQVVSCAGPNRIFQGCLFTNGSPDVAWSALEQQAVADLLKVHQLPAGDSARLLGWERDTLRALLFDKLVTIITTDPAQRTTADRTVYDQLAAFVRSKRLAAATFSKAEYDRWARNPCAYEAPPGFRYDIPSSCASPLGDLFGGPQPPSLEEFTNYGSAHVLGQFQTDPALRASAGNTAKSMGIAVGIATGVGTAAGTAAAIPVVIAALQPVLVASAITESAAVASSTATAVVAGASTFAGVAAIVIVAATIGIIQGINVVEAAAIPGKLDDAITAARATPNLKDVISGESGVRELFAYVLMATMPDYPATGGVPAQQPTDTKFELNPGPSAQVTDKLAYRSWDGSAHAAYLSGGWLVDGAANALALTLSLDYLNHAGEKWTAWRIGNRFLHTTPGDTKPSFESDQIQYQDPSGANRTARIQPVAPVVTFTDEGSITVTVTTPPPTFAGLPTDMTADQTSADGAVVTYPTPTATDDGGNPATVSCAPASGSTFPPGSTTVTCTATPRYGTAATASFTVTVRETFCLAVPATILPRPFDELIVGTPGNDVIVGTPGNDIIYGGGGDDLICGLDGDDLINGEGGNDRLYGDRAHGGDGGDDTLDGGEGRDELFGGPGIDRLLGGDGDDYLEDYEGANQTFDGGGGDRNHCVGVRTAAPAGTITNCQIRSP